MMREGAPAQQAAEAAEAERLCHGIVGALNVPAFVHRGGDLLFTNAALQRLLGYGPGQLQRLSHIDLAAPESRLQMEAYGRACLGVDPEPAATEMMLVTVNGEERFVELISRRLDVGGLPTVLSTCTDLSDIRHVQTSLLNMSQVLNQILNSDPVATFVIDAEHHVSHWNRACEALTGRSQWDMQGVAAKGQVFYREERALLCDLIVDGLDAEAIRSAYAGTVRPSAMIEGAYEAEDFFPNFGEGGRWLYLTAAPLRDARGQLVGAIETLQDVTARKVAEEELMRHRNQLEVLVSKRTAELNSRNRELAAFMENATVGIVATSKGLITRHNRMFAEMFLAGGTPGGAAIPSAVGRHSREFFCNAGDFEAFFAMAEPRLMQGLPVHHEMFLQRDDGQQLWIQMISYALDQDDPSAGAWWMLQDRTEVRRAQAQLEANVTSLREINRRLEDAQNQLLQSEKMASIGQLAAGVAHEINNPIGFVNSNLASLHRYVGGLLQLIDAYQAQEPALPEVPRAALAQLRQTVDLDYLREDLPVLLSESAEGLTRVKRIVQDLKDFSRVDNADWQDADINAGLDSTLNVVYNEIKYRAEVRKHYGPLPRVHCLAAQLNQVFLNLIVNAAHAMPQQGVLTLSTGQVGDWVWVEVADTGCGMSAETQKRIFEPFFTTKPVGQGTGLGLSLSFSIVQKHKGVIKVHSELGQGTAFRVWLPVNCSEHEEAPPFPMAIEPDAAD